MAPLDVDLGGLASVLTDNYNAPAYQPTTSVRHFKDSPRFGSTSNFNLLLTGSSSERKDYIKGILIGGIIILSVFVLWSIILIILRCLGWERVGFLSGVMKKPARPSSLSSSTQGGKIVDDNIEEHEDEHDNNDGNEIEEYEEKVKKFKYKLMWVRIVFLLAAVLVIIASIMFYSVGINSLVDSINNFQVAFNDVGDIFLSAQNAARNFIDDNTDELSHVQQPSYEPFFEDFECKVDLDSLLQLDVPLNDTINQMNDFLEDNSKEAASNAQKIYDGLGELIELQQDVVDQLDGVKPILYTALSITIVSSILVIILMTCCIIAWRGVEKKKTTKWRRWLLNLLKCVRNVVTLPIFIVLMVLAWVISCVFLAAAVATSDFCFDPDASTLKLLESKEGNLDEIVFDAITYYVMTCKNEFYTATLEETDQVMLVVANATVAIHEGVTAALSVDWVQVTNVCDLGFDPNLLQTLLVRFDGVLHKTIGLLNDLLSFMSCSTFNPIYRKTIYEGICVDAADGFVWIYATALTIAICSMLMVTLRVAYYEIPEEEEKGEFNIVENENGIEEEGIEEDDFQDEGKETAAQVY